MDSKLYNSENVFPSIDMMNSNYSCTKTTLLCISMVLLFGGLETLLILTLRVVKRYHMVQRRLAADTSLDTSQQRNHLA